MPRTHDTDSLKQESAKPEVDHDDRKYPVGVVLIGVFVIAYLLWKMIGYIAWPIVERIWAAVTS